ncbi:hypothetical protein M9Y10_000004 [Tritrichomonas musculus]|uniref:Uncharacterized protein n=1 Tax=Tritrichomonas musculus TaxID=1915356 RepID=A0ABR2L348_9EUKA
MPAKSIGKSVMARADALAGVRADAKVQPAPARAVEGNARKQGTRAARPINDEQQVRRVVRCAVLPAVLKARVAPLPAAARAEPQVRPVRNHARLPHEVLQDV